MTDGAERMPRSVKLALAGVWFQAVVNAVFGFFILDLVDDRLAHGQDVPDLSLVRFSAYLALCAAALLLISGVFAAKRFGWVRLTVLIVECVAVLVSLVNLFVSAIPSAVIGLLLAVFIGRTVLGDPGRLWFNR